MDFSRLMRQTVLGFDARQKWKDCSSEWAHRRRSLYLMDPNVSQICSVDNVSWPEVLDEFPEWVGPVHGLWDDTERLKEHLEKKGLKEFHRIAVTLVTENMEEKDLSMVLSSWGGLEEIVLPADREFMGFDIADSTLVSGLTNCGYTPEEAKLNRDRYSSDLNSFHLFDTLNQASSYCFECNERVPEHAPFYVYGIYKI